MNDYIIMDFMFSVNDEDFYVKAFIIDEGLKKIKITKEEFIKWCKSHEDDDQCYEISYYASFYEF
ncbi:hypothetical protein [Clostridium perfringens]|uniref:hypothetical protein n=1 Tax=Clostridium perfringens TaxID=1502 RepID=UPI0011152AB7|nr:hypothetical protein [Clostridium perfringens]